MNLDKSYKLINVNNIISTILDIKKYLELCQKCKSIDKKLRCEKCPNYADMKLTEDYLKSLILNIEVKNGS